jgi:hypothetical protein
MMGIRLHAVVLNQCKTTVYYLIVQKIYLTLLYIVL